MADEQLSIRVETLSESVRTAMTFEDAEEPLSVLTDIIENCVNEGGHAHELCGIVFRSLLPCFVMTDADFKTPGSLNQPNKAMHSVKQACVAWLIKLAKLLPSIATSVSVDRLGYCRRMHLAVTENAPEEKEHWSDDDEGGKESAENADNEENVSPGNAVARSGESVCLDPIVALLERLAVRCPDKTEWRKSVISDVVAVLLKSLPAAVCDRFRGFLIRVLHCDKTAWRVFALESFSLLPVDERIFEHIMKRTRDIVPGVRSAAMKSVAAVYLDNPSVCDRSAIVSMFIAQSRDEKPSVRRAALTVFDTLVSVQGLLPFFVLATLAMDESLMVRKSCVSSILSVVPHDTPWCELWCSSVLPLVTDVESTVIEKVVESVEFCLLNGLVAKNSTEVHTLTRQISESWESIEYTKRAVRIVLRKGDAKFSKQVATSVVAHIGASLGGIPCLWSLVEELVEFLSVKVLLDLCVSAMNGESSVDVLKSVFRVLKSAIGGGRKCSDSTDCFDKIYKWLCAYVSEPKSSMDALHDAIYALHSVHALVSGGSNNRGMFDSLLKASEEKIELIVRGEFVLGAEWYISSLGEIASLGFLPSVQGLTGIEAIGTNRVYIFGENESSTHLTLSSAIRGLAMVAFGKICLQKESIAKRAVSKFAAHLSREEHPVVRNNVLIVLGDLCVLYTGLVDQYLPWVTNCLSDKNDLIRFQAAVVVSSLLAEDYIKFKGQIIFRLLYLLSDSNLKIKYFVESVFSRILFLRHSTSLKTLFAETVCAMNGYSRHPQFQGASGNRDFCLVANPTRRREIYSFMLANVQTTEQKFNSIVQLANSLLAAFVDEDVTNGQVQIPERETDPAGQVLVDTLYLLGCKELKLSTNTPIATEEAPEEDVSKKLFDAALQKKTIVDNLVPLLIQLNRLCESRRSPISRYVRDCLRELIKDYKEDISHILHADTQLGEELLFDMRQANTDLGIQMDVSMDPAVHAVRQSDREPTASDVQESAHTRKLYDVPDVQESVHTRKSSSVQDVHTRKSSVSSPVVASSSESPEIPVKRSRRTAVSSKPVKASTNSPLVKHEDDEKPESRGSSRLARKRRNPN